MTCEFCGEETTEDEAYDGLLILNGNTLCHKDCLAHEQEENA